MEGKLEDVVQEKKGLENSKEINKKNKNNSEKLEKLVQVSWSFWSTNPI